MKNTFKWAALALAATISLPALAHKAFIVPSSTVLSDEEAWITLDAAAGNDLFYFNHRPLNLEHLAVRGPEGYVQEIDNRAEGKLRASADVHLTKPGTYRIGTSMEGLFAFFVDAEGKRGRARGTPENIDKQIPAGAKDVRITQTQSIVETYVTLGKPDASVFAPTGKGLEFVPVTHPNDLFAGEPAKFRFLLDGKPAKDLEVTVIPGATRYRNAQDEIKLKTDAAGEFSVTWPAAGMYWMNASVEGGKPSVAKAQARRASYTATFEVLPQ